MKVLFLHPDDAFGSAHHPGRWDLIVDLARAPKSAYERWSRESGCPAMSLHDLAEEIQDLYRLKQLIAAGTGRVVDRLGIDWWDVLSLMIAPDLQQMILLPRLARHLPPGCDLYCSRADAWTEALGVRTGARIFRLHGGRQPALRRLGHYRDVLLGLDWRQLAQVAQDKFDPQHTLRRRFGMRRSSAGNPVVLLPSAYANVSRTAVSYAALLPSQRFLLVCARAAGRLPNLPANTEMRSLDPYFVAGNRAEITSLQASWNALQQELASSIEEFQVAASMGLLSRIRSLLPWGIAIRDAWNELFQAENISACLSADDSNPYTRIPLLLSRAMGLPTLSCHHGAMDWAMAVKAQHANYYLAKGEMETDYLLRVCRVAPEQIQCGAPSVRLSHPEELAPTLGEGWLVLFTEAYQAAGWRSDEVYGDLLPRLSALAEKCSLQLALKLHPFDSVRRHRRLLRQHLSGKARQVRIIAGPPSAELWKRIRIAITGQSTVALECAARRVPVFLCAWLRDSRTGYFRQFERFGIGQVLESPDTLDDIPGRLEDAHWTNPGRVWQPMDPQKLRELLAGAATETIPRQSLRAKVRAGA